MTSLTLTITNDLDLHLDNLAVKAGITKSDLFKKAIILMDVAITECGAGNKLVVLDKDNNELHEITGILKE